MSFSLKCLCFYRSRTQSVSSQQAEIESDITETNDSDTADSYQVVSSTTDDVLLKSKGKEFGKMNITS